jgi:sugar phosphate isomerase/epimerase
MIRLAIQSRLVPGASLHEKYETARSYGFDGMELSHSPMIEAAEEAIREGVPVTAMCSGHRGWFIDPDPARIAACREDVKRLLELGAELDAPLIVVPIYGRTHNLPAHCGTGRTRDEDRALWLDGLREVTAHAEKVGGRLVVEAINRFENSISVKVADAAAFARQMASPNVRAMGDVFHMNIEEVDMGGALEAEADMIAYLHLADSQRLEPGKGHLDLENVFRGLVRMGYDGYASMECNLSGPAAEVLPDAVRFLRDRIAAAEAAVGASVAASSDRTTDVSSRVAVR